ncbi:MAG: isochorismatase family protein [Desulfovibrio sp.]|nr:isochorismatase family protein [Desulfovibrio sp.]
MILVIIDPQHGFFDHAMPENLASRLGQLLSKKIFHAVVATQFINTPNDAFQQFTGWDGLHGAERNICKEIQPWLNAIIPKSGFNGAITPVMQVLRTLNGECPPQAVFLAGTDTEACIMASAMGFFEKGIRPLVLADYCASSGGLSVHQAGLLCLERAIGKMNIVHGDPSCTFVSDCLNAG